MSIRQFYSNLSIKRRAALIAVLITALNFIAVPLFGIASVDFEQEYIPVAAFVLSTVLFLGHIPFCIAMRIRRVPEILLGIFFYQLIGIVCYILFFAGYIGGQGADNALTAFYSVFSWWTTGYQNLFVMLSRFTGIPLKFTGAILFMLHSYITAAMYAATKKDIRYEEEKKNQQEYVEKTKGRHSAI